MTKSCEPSGTGGGFYAARQVTVVMKDVEFQGCSSAIAGGAVYLNTNSSANISASTVRDCRAMDGGGLQLIISFETSQRIKRWQASSSLMYGNLVCLSTKGCFAQGSCSFVFFFKSHRKSLSAID